MLQLSQGVCLSVCVSVCLFVCMSVRLCHLYSPTDGSIYDYLFRKWFYICLQDIFFFEFLHFDNEDVMVVILYFLN